MKTTIDLPDALFEQTRIAAAQRGTTIKNLVIEGLHTVLGTSVATPSHEGALERLRKGFHLGGKPLSREAAHGR